MPAIKLLKASWLFLTLLMLVAFPCVASALSQDQIDVYNSGIDYFDVSAGSAGPDCSSVTLTGSDAKQQVWNYYISQGLSPVATAALMGNFADESNFNPTDTNTSSGAYGLAQWLGGRLTSLQSLDSYDTLPVQLAFSWHELSGSYKSSVTDVINAPGESIDSATQTVYDFYEGLINSGQGSVSHRTANAVGFLTLYGNSGSTEGGSSSSTVNASGCVGSSGGSSNANTAYQNPLRGVSNLTPERIDQGVDYAGSGPIYALGDGTLINIHNSGWAVDSGPPTFMVYKLSDGPAQGLYVYVAENCLPNPQLSTTAPNNQVTSNTVLCTLVNASPNLETGWADGSAIGDAAAHSVWGLAVDDTQHYTAYGLNFNQLLQSLANPPPSGTIQPGAIELGTLGNTPNGGPWPTW